MSDLWDNPMGTDGFEFVEYTGPEPAQLAALFERMGFVAAARHRSKNVTLYKQGDVNFIVNAEPESFAQAFARVHGPSVCAIAFRATLDYVRERQAFGRSIAEFQNTRFKLAEVATQIAVGRAFIDRCVEELLVGTLDAATASMAKLWASEAEGHVIDELLQLHGGYGYMNEFMSARMYADARIARIYGGNNEIMKEVIARAL